MLHFDGVVRTVRIVKPYSVTQRNGRNGAFESKMIMFTVAVDREYRHAVAQQDGTVKQEYQTDFYTVRATGPLADRFNQYCSATKEDGKLASRRLYIRGHLETYDNTRNETVAFVENGVQKQLQVALPEKSKIILVLDSMTFLDANPSNANGETVQAQVVNATPVAQPTVAQPVAAEPVQATPVAQAQPTVAQPVAQTPVAPVVGAVNAEEAPF